MKRFLIEAVKKYQSLISPLLGANCIYQPTCSQYAVGTLEDKPLPQALILITARLASCNPVNACLKRRAA